HPDQDALESLARIDWDKDEVVGYVGKFIISKGVHPILAALPGLLHQRKDVKLLLIGFGTYREGLEALIGALDSGREDLLQMIGELGYALEVEEKEHPLPHLLEFWDGLRKKGTFSEYLKKASSVNLRDRVIFTGILGHEHIRYLLPCTDVSLVPSIFPEAFGMVSAEALSCGVVPLASYHSGLINILDTVNQETKGRFGDSLRIDPTPSHMVESIERNVLTVLKQVAPDLAAVKKNCRQIALDHFSWSAVCDRFVELPALVKV
ncbi:MAG: glycosyltransferase family 4 protein, partial [Armatimonadetes bacterium]|nr:glycosyltransferase family 4 protein [Armatimonadota bacterium]